MSAQPPAAQPEKPDNAIALVSSDDADSLYATVQWLLNPLPGGSLLFERPDPRIAELERAIAAAQAERDDFKFAYLSVIQERMKARAEAATLREAFERECAEGDKLCDALGVSRTEGGSLNVPKMLAAIQAAVAAERERIKTLEDLLLEIETVSIETDGMSVCDSIDNNGDRYPSQFLADTLAAIDAARGAAHD